MNIGTRTGHKLQQVINFGLDTLRDYSQAVSKEWLVTNGIGGYASGTVAGTLTRRYHGLLIAALDPPLGRKLLISKVDETARYGGSDYPLFTNHWASGSIDPVGYKQIERFHLEGTTPVWTFSLADALVEKRIWMQYGENTTYLRYDFTRGSGALTLSLNVFVNYRDHHANTTAGDWKMVVEAIPDGLQVIPFEGASPFYMYAPGAQITINPVWNFGFFQSIEAYRGLDPLDDHLRLAVLEVTLHQGEGFWIAGSTREDPDLRVVHTLRARQEYEIGLLDLATGLSDQPYNDPFDEQLILSADQFIVARDIHGQVEGKTILAGYPWFTDWGRDTMISLSGLTLATGRPEIAKGILRTYAQFVDQGMLPNRFPEAGEDPEYNTVDATLWYFEAIRAYFAESMDKAFIQELFPVLEEIIAWHIQGTRFQIKLDESDGLLFAGQPGLQLTWMDAKVDDWVVTPRIGKPVEINALWFNALMIMRELSQLVGGPTTIYTDLAGQAKRGFARYWIEAPGYCFDVIDGPNGPDESLRPNQLFAVSLPHSPLTDAQARSLVDVCTRSLYTPFGLRSLAPKAAAFVGNYGGDQKMRDAAYHQGTVWGWLIGPFISAQLKVYKNPDLARSYLKPILRNLFGHGVGFLSEIFDGEAPYPPRGCIAQAWSVAEVLRVSKDIRSMES
jgi:predicted glycogen debranching enzyme